jgi:hypothetical protein
MAMDEERSYAGVGAGQVGSHPAGILAVNPV